MIAASNVATAFAQFDASPAGAADEFFATAAKSVEQADTGHLFASAAAIQVLREARSAFDPEDIDPMNPEETLAALRRMESAYTDSAKKVAAEGRRHMGLEPLIEPAPGEEDA